MFINFSSSATNKVDGKGRVSIPAAFRKVLEGENAEYLCLLPELTGDMAVMACGPAYFNKLAEGISRLNPFSEEAMALADLVGGQSHQISLDGTGRIVLPAELKEFAGIEDEVRFVGGLTKFQLWNPATYVATRPKMTKSARESLGNIMADMNRPGEAE